MRNSIIIFLVITVVLASAYMADAGNISPETNSTAKTLSDANSGGNNDDNNGGSGGSSGGSNGGGNGGGSGWSYGGNGDCEKVSILSYQLTNETLKIRASRVLDSIIKDEYDFKSMDEFVKYKCLKTNLTFYHEGEKTEEIIEPFLPPVVDNTNQSNQSNQSNDAIMGEIPIQEYNWKYWLQIIVPYIILLLLAMLVILTVYLIIKRRKKENKKKQEDTKKQAETN